MGYGNWSPGQDGVDIGQRDWGLAHSGPNFAVWYVLSFDGRSENTNQQIQKHYSRCWSDTVDIEICVPLFALFPRLVCREAIF